MSSVLRRENLGSSQNIGSNLLLSKFFNFLQILSDLFQLFDNSLLKSSRRKFRKNRVLILVSKRRQETRGNRHLSQLILLISIAGRSLSFGKRVFIVQTFNSSWRGNLRQSSQLSSDLFNLQHLSNSSNNGFSLVSSQVLLKFSFINNDLKFHILFRGSTAKVSGHRSSLPHVVTVTSGAQSLARLVDLVRGSLRALVNISGLHNLVDLLVQTSFSGDVFSLNKLLEFRFRNLIDLVRGSLRALVNISGLH